MINQEICVNFALKIIKGMFKDLEYNDTNNLNLIYDIEFEKLCNYLHRDDIPKELTYTLACRVAGKELETNLIFKENQSMANLEVLNNILELKEYETTIKYSSKNDFFNFYVKKLVDYGKEELMRWRLVVWK